MSQHHTIGHVGYSPDYKTPRVKGYWENMEYIIAHSPSINYPTRTQQDLEIADLKRENNAAFQRIQELSDALYQLGYDPTARR